MPSNHSIRRLLNKETGRFELIQIYKLAGFSGDQLGASPSHELGPGQQSERLQTGSTVWSIIL